MKTTVGSLALQVIPEHHARDDVPHAMMMTRTGAVEGCGRVPCDHSKDSRDSAPKTPGLRTEKTH